MNKIVGIHQPNLMPWLGYFYKIYKSDTFVFLDDVQFQKTGGNYTNRVSILSKGETQYLTVAVRRPSGVIDINKVEFSDKKWRKKIEGSIQACYGRCDFYKEHKKDIFSLIQFETKSLSEFNINFIKGVSRMLKIDTCFFKSSEMALHGASTSRLLEIVKECNGGVYLSGGGGDKYQNKELFNTNGIGLTYNICPDFNYEQSYTISFVNGLSILDSIFNVGIEQLRKEIFQ